MKKVVFFGTHPKQYNGYSKVVYELAKCLANYDDIELTIYGFQNFHSSDKYRNDIPHNVKVYDVFANEYPRTNGFGPRQVVDFISLCDPDICIVYNDMVVTSAIVSELRKVPNAKFKIIGYIDQVYLNQKKVYIDFINKSIDMSLLFTKNWEKNIIEQGVKTLTSYLPHGFSSQTFYPVPKHIARQYFNLNMNDFIILNLNKNQPRKRWDICLKAFADIVSRYPNDPIKMIIGTTLQGEWNLMELYERELEKRDVSFEVGMKHIILLDNPHKNTDEETNLLYNVADIGINTCDGEGFGLCNFEQAGVGIPQIVPKLGGFLEFLDEDSAILIDPQMAYYVGTSRDNVGGEALLISYMDVADAIETYYQDKDLREKHGKMLRQKITQQFKWGNIAQKLKNIIDQTHMNEKHDKSNHKEEKEEKEEKEKEAIKNLVTEIDEKENKENKEVKKETTMQSQSKLEPIDTETLDQIVALKNMNGISNDKNKDKKIKR